jgi:hypothetical protein
MGSELYTPNLAHMGYDPVPLDGSHSLANRYKARAPACLKEWLQERQRLTRRAFVLLRRFQICAVAGMTSSHTGNRWR